MTIKSTDMVGLIAVTHHNHVWLGYMSVVEASRHIRGWWEAREKARTGSPEDSALAQEWLSKGTAAVNADLEDVEGTVALAVVAWEHVVGIYIETRTSAQDRIATAMEKTVSGEIPGDEWKKGEGEEES